MICASILAKKDKITIDAWNLNRASIGVLAANLKSDFLKRGSKDFFEILDLSTPNTRQKYLLNTKCLNCFSRQAMAVDRCEMHQFVCFIHTYLQP